MNWLQFSCFGEITCFLGTEMLQKVMEECCSVSVGVALPKWTVQSKKGVHCSGHPALVHQVWQRQRGVGLVRSVWIVIHILRVFWLCGIFLGLLEGGPKRASVVLGGSTIVVKILLLGLGPFHRLGNRHLKLGLRAVFDRNPMHYVIVVFFQKLDEWVEFDHSNKQALFPLAAQAEAIIRTNQRRECERREYQPDHIVNKIHTLDWICIIG